MPFVLTPIIGNAYKYVGLSTDPKPTGVPIGTKVWEYDIDITEEWNGTEWVLSSNCIGLSDIKISEDTTLLADTSFTSDEFSAKAWGWVVGTCYADKSGTLTCQFSNDGGLNWDGEHNLINYVAGEKLAFSFEVAGALSRLVFTNGAYDQSEFRLTCYLRKGL